MEREKHNRKNRVNTLISKVFGRLWRGDWDISISTLDGTYWNTKHDDLGYIGIGIPFITAYKIGKFSNPDGSELKIKEKYVEQAKKYSELYEKEFGEKVIIHKISRDESFPSTIVFRPNTI